MKDRYPIARTALLGSASAVLAISLGGLLAPPTDAAAAPPPGRAPAQTPEKPPRATPPAPAPANDPDPITAFSDALVSAKKAVTKAEDVSAQLKVTLTDLGALYPKDEPGDAVAGRLATVTARVKALTDNKVSQALEDLVPAESGGSKSLKYRLDTLEKTWKALSDEQKKDHEKEYTETRAKLQDLQGELAERRGALRPALDQVYADVGKIVGVLGKATGLAKLLLPATSINAEEPVESLRQRLEGGLQVLSRAIVLRRAFEEQWTALEAALKKERAGDPNATPHDSLAKPITAGLYWVDEQLLRTTSRVDGWLDRLYAAVLDADKAATGLLNRSLDQPYATRVDVKNLALSAGGLVRDVTASSTQTVALMVQLDHPGTKAFLEPKDERTLLGAAKQRLDDTTGRATISIALLQDDTVYDFGDWTSREIKLYYFDDVRRLMQVLAPSAPVVAGDLATFATAAQTAREALATATQDFRNKQVEVNNAKYQVELLEEELRQKQLDALDKLKQAQADLGRARQENTRNQARIDAAQRAKADADLEVKKAEADFNQAKGEYDALPDTDPNKGKARQKMLEAQHRVDLAKGLSARRQADVDRLGGTTGTQTAVTTAQTRVDTLTNEVEGTAGPVKDARDALKTARDAAATALQNVREQMKNASLATSKDVQAFAELRDNQPVIVSRPTFSRAETDVLKRVQLYGFPDRRVLVIRGKRDDVRKVKDIVAREFDRPQPQAMMMLWSLEMSSKGDKSGHDKAQRALALIDQEVARGRRDMSAVLTLLYRSIDQVVAEKVSDTSGADNARWTFYRPELLQGFKQSDYALLSGYLPRPSGASTLAEAITILALAKPAYARDVREKFLTGLAALDIKAQPASTKTIGGRTLETPATEDVLDRLWEIIGIPGQFVKNTKADAKPAGTKNSQGSDSNPASVDEKRVNAMSGRRQAARTVVAASVDAHPSAIGQALIDTIRIRILQSALKRVEELEPKIQTLLNELQVLSEARDKAPAAERVVWDARFLTKSNQLSQQYSQFVSLAMLVYQGFNVTAPAFPTTASDGAIELPRATVEISKLEDSTPDGLTFAQEAKVNGLLKGAINAVTEDLSRTFVEPMFRQVGENIRAENGVNLGVIQRTSIVASNRLVARVDPRASAQVPLGEEIKLFDDVMHAVQLGAVASTGGAAAVLGGLNRLPKDKPQTIYGLGTGSTFTVTPIIDPSGQALRFMLDYNTATQVREPNGASSPSLSTIERHSVNTEVQLSNLELGEVSRFEADAALGLPRRTTGGLPVLRYIPVLKEIPLIGWFTLRKGAAATIQRSMIFGHTTMFTTIESVLQVLTPPAAGAAAGNPSSQDQQKKE